MFNETKLVFAWNIGRRRGGRNERERESWEILALGIHI